MLATAVVLPDGTGYLTSQLPRLPAGRTYQLWGVDNRNTISLGVMGRDPDVVAFQAAGHPAAIAVTEERAGGVPVTQEQSCRGRRPQGLTRRLHATTAQSFVLEEVGREAGE